ncbi:hypothetical protein LSH36_266g02057 [Paralvinella palmiformis]|uniref:Uncharacterized protein n=1 Tax=Paralvinella palmiformis TaxID=53620 RepID=A0AAD9JK27_9ANNE|nr:hypothetical protein LSH36_266g02057 [Paralvinella palmiformis]
MYSRTVYALTESAVTSSICSSVKRSAHNHQPYGYRRCRDEEDNNGIPYVCGGPDVQHNRLFHRHRTRGRLPARPVSIWSTDYQGPTRC